MERMKKLKYEQPSQKGKIPEGALSADLFMRGVESQQCFDNGINNILKD